MKAIIYLFLLITFSGLAAYTGYNYATKQTTSKDKTDITIEVSPTPTQEVVSTTESGWQYYYNTQHSFRIQHPTDVMVEEREDDTISFVKAGPSQKSQTEFYDGINVSIYQGSIGSNKNLESLVKADIEQKKEQLSPDFKVVKPLSPITISDMSGFSYTASEILGDRTYIYLPQYSDKFLLISNITRDPEKQGFQNIADKMINSVELIK